jgi:hypothetical protein
VHGLVALAVVRFGLTLSLGPEYDSNANRAEVVARAETPDTPVGSFLIRATADGQLVWRKGINILRVVGGLGGKIFFNPAVFDQDVGVLQLGAEDRVRAARFLHLAVAADYYDAWQLDIAPYRHRDFRSGSALGRVYFVDRLGEVMLAGGYRGFQYKPDPYFDFQAAEASVRAVTRLHFGANQDHELDLASSYHLERRYFPGVIQSLDESLCPPGHPILDMCLVAAGDGTRRADWWHEGGIELTYVGPLLVALGWAAQLDLSNSFGQSLLRQLLTLKLAYRFPWNLYATVKAQLLVTRYLDPVLLDRVIQTATFVTIEDENRNAIIVDVERPIGATGLAVDARYSLYTNEISPSPVSFLRHLVYLGLTYRLGAR